jgi:serine/threonine-protein kinase
MAERFTLLSELGRGGMGVVWKARDEETGQIVALKLLHAAFVVDADYVTRFERELELAKRIHSAHVVEVLGFGARDGVPYLALEYVEGPSLRELLKSHGPYSWPEAKDLLIQITQGLADAHAAGVIHRDLKPSNVLIGPDGVAKLADFGIAKGLDLTRVTGTSTLLGTPAYLAPEGPIDERSDLYSLGIIAFELLTGTAPFAGSTYQEVIVRHIREAPDLGKLPLEARDIVGWLLAKEPAARPQRASQLMAALYGAVPGQKVGVVYQPPRPFVVQRPEPPIHLVAQRIEPEPSASAPPPRRVRDFSLSAHRKARPAIAWLGVLGLLACFLAVALASIHPPTTSSAKSTASTEMDSTTPTPGLVEVPNLLGMNEDDALNALNAAGLRAGARSDQYDPATPAIPAGRVLSTNPGVATLVSANSTVSYVVSEGPANSVPADELVNPGTLTVCSDTSYSPRESLDSSGIAVGSDIDLAREIAARMGLSLSVKSVVFDSLIPALKGGSCDAVISAQTVTADRLSQVDMIPYFKNSESLVEGISVSKNRSQIRDAVQAALKSMMDDGTYVTILTRWGLPAAAITP